MATITPSEAISLVRKALDELEPNWSEMYEEGNDNSNLDDTIKRSLPEAINAVCKAAPVTLLEGEDTTIVDASTPAAGEELRTPSFNVSGAAGPILRLVAFRYGDTDQVVTAFTEEASVEGRKQLNPYIRGTYDKPVLVRKQDARNTFVYYSTKEPLEPGTAALPQVFTVIYEQKYTSGALSYFIPAELRQNIIDQLTAMVLENYADQRSQTYYSKANQFAA